jgi:hypothetical protein
MTNTAAVMDKGMQILLKTLGVLDTELFISTILKEPFDYTEWSRDYFAGYDPTQFLQEAVQYDRDNPVPVVRG